MLFSGLDPQLHSSVVLCSDSQVAGEESKMGVTVKIDSFVHVVQIPRIAGCHKMTVTRIVVNQRAVTLIHFPVTDEMSRRRHLGELALALSLCIVVGDIP